MIADCWYVGIVAALGNVAFYGREEGDKVLARKVTHIVLKPNGQIGLAKWPFMDMSSAWFEDNLFTFNRSAVIGLAVATKIAADDFERAWNPNGIILANGSQDVKRAEEDAKRFKAL